MRRIYFIFVNNGRNGNKADATARQYILFALLFAANVFMSVYCFSLYSHLRSIPRSSVMFQEGAIRPLDAETGLSAFDSPALAALKSAFINFDTAYLKKFSADINEINLKSAFSVFSVLKIVEAAFQNYIFINSFSINRTAPFKVSVKISGFTPSNNYFITFCDYLSRAKNLEGFTFETKENPGTRSTTAISPPAPEDKGGTNFGITFDYTVKLK